MDNEVLLTTKKLTKSFGLTHALKGVDITIRRGLITGLIGENGSGKSTFSSIISGTYPKSSGEITYKGAQYNPVNALDAQNQGISMIMQEMGTIPGIRVADNIFIGKEAKFTQFGVVNRKKMYAEAKKAMEEIGVTGIDPAVPVTNYDLEDRKMIEIVRAFYNNPEIFIVDETTTALSQKGREILYNIINKFKQENKAVIFVSHDLDELMTVCDNLIILRDGDYIAELQKSEFEAEKIKELMVGRKLTGDYYRSDYDGSFSDEVVLRVENVCSETSLKNIDLELHKGEILGIGGLTDSGMHELGRIIFGMEKPLLGQVVLENGAEITSSVEAVKQKIGYVSKNRDQEALILDASILENTVMPSYRQLTKVGLISDKSEIKFTNKQIASLNIKCRSIKQDVKDLSGGNKQKVVFGKWLGNESQIFILDCPTRGIDVGVKAAMYQLMYHLKKEGKSIIMISEELTELIGMSDRIIILKNGKMGTCFNRSIDLTESVIIKEMV